MEVTFATFKGAEEPFHQNNTYGPTSNQCDLVVCSDSSMSNNTGGKGQLNIWGSWSATSACSYVQQVARALVMMPSSKIIVEEQRKAKKYFADGLKPLCSATVVTMPFPRRGWLC